MRQFFDHAPGSKNLDHLSRPPFLWQIEVFHQEDRHLISSYRSVGAIVAISTTCRDPLRCQLLDPGCCPVVCGHILEHTCRCRRHIARSMLGFQQEDRHLVTGHRGSRTVLFGTDTTAGRDPFRCQLLDPSCCPVVCGHILEHTRSLREVHNWSHVCPSAGRLPSGRGSPWWWDNTLAD